MLDRLNIRQLEYPDLDFIAELTAIEGWDSETRQELAGSLEYDPGGCFIAEVDGHRVGACIATPYREFGFLGELIVVQQTRGYGIGGKLMKQAIDYLRSLGIRIIFLDGVLAAVPLYERLGFRKICRSWRFSGEIPGQVHADVHPMTDQDLEPVVELDRQAFGAERRFFIQRRLRLYPELCRVSRNGAQVNGFIMGRRGRENISVGPWVVNFINPHASLLLESLASQIPGCKMRIGVLAENQAAIQMLRSYGLIENPGSPWRMALGGSAIPENADMVVAIGSPAKG